MYNILTKIGGKNMEQCYRKDLRPFDMKRLNELRKLRKGNIWWYSDNGKNSSFFNELECVLKCNPKSYFWTKKDNDKIVLGDVWSQPIGKYYHKHTVHVFEYMYIGSQGIVIDFHSHQEVIHGGKQIAKITEFYIFDDGTMYVCPKDQEHALINTYGRPIYIISLKICRNNIH